MKIYIAASYEAHELAHKVAKILSQTNTIKSTWHEEEYMPIDKIDDKNVWKYGLKCIVELGGSDCIVYLSTPHKSMGGRDFELGYAYAKSIPVIWVGPRTHIFSHLRSMHSLDGMFDMEKLDEMVSKTNEQTN